MIIVVHVIHSVHVWKTRAIMGSYWKINAVSLSLVLSAVDLRYWQKMK